MSRTDTRAATSVSLLVIEGHAVSRDTLAARLELLGYRVHAAADRRQALGKLETRDIALVLFDPELPELSGPDLLAYRESTPHLSDVPFVVVADPDATATVVRCIELGADDYLTRPVDPVLLQVRVRASLQRRRLRQLEGGDSAVRSRAEAAALESQESSVESERLAQLRRFVSPQVADLINSPGNEDALESHRREITVVFCDLRGYTAFSETAEPEDVMGVLRELHAAMGATIFDYQGTLERFTGDGIMVFFNDPVPVPDHVVQAVRMAVVLQAQATELGARWLNRGYELALGMGLATGYATLGRIGFEGRFDYAAIGNVTNLAARLCGEAGPGQILIDRRVWTAVADVVDTEPVGRLQLKNIHRPVEAFNVVGLKRLT